MKVSKRLAVLLLLVFVVSIVAGCQSKTTENQTETPKAPTETKEPIKVGVNVELSGGVASYGTNCRNGVVLAFDEINKAGGVDGRTIDYVIMDCKSDSAEATNVAARLVGQKVVALIGPLVTGSVLGAEPIASKNKIPLIAPAATAMAATVDEKTGKTKEFVFRTCFIDPFQGGLMGNYAYDTLKAKKAAILMDTSTDYSKGLAKAFKEAFVGKGGTIVAEEGYVKNDKDFKATLTKIKNKVPDVIYVPGYYNEAGLIIKQARELGITVPILGGDGWDSAELVNIAGAKALNNTFFTNHYSSADKDPKVVKFVKAYEAAYKTTPDAFAALGYDSAYLLVDAIKRAGSTDGVKIKEALAATKDFSGVTGTFSMDELHNPVKSAVLIEMVDGKQVVKTKIQP
ncbi:MAG: ABC transporter substrate-binding protein [Syntrophothermus sp.]|uniref:ABC transporter substrate-binding protein n=1 Tax=Syntrophothermus sp. TaxID=2736299 RepID=UPI002579BC29|nr:ABC transporter substrate-binding protein [Syntrophothermus sp.]NSW83836.1 ABC transporter substrate-binding protein [Syntrophothermus sp.]